MYRVYIGINSHWYFASKYRHTILTVIDSSKMRKIFPLPFCCIIKSYFNFTKLLLSHVQCIQISNSMGSVNQHCILLTVPSQIRRPLKSTIKKIYILLLGTQVLINHVNNFLHRRLVASILITSTVHITIFATNAFYLCTFIVDMLYPA